MTLIVKGELERDMPKYNKLVRDLIPQIIEKSGQSFSISTIEEKEYIAALKEKLREEVEEYLNAENNQDSLEELADILEIIYALVKVHGESFDKFADLRRINLEKSGGFNDKVLLNEVEDN